MTDLFGNERMLALSWKQPFGTAMLIGKVETRVWITKYRGRVLICTSKAAYNEESVRRICGNDLFVKMLMAIQNAPDTVDLDGYAIAVGDLIDCREMRPEDESLTYVKYRAPWTEERKGKDGIIRKVNLRLYCHFYENVRPIKPFPWRGSQGWKEVPERFIPNIEYL